MTLEYCSSYVTNVPLAPFVSPGGQDFLIGSETEPAFADWDSGHPRRNPFPIGCGIITRPWNWAADR